MDFRKSLVMSTALTAVGALAAGQAAAAEKPKLSISGYYDIFMGISDQDDTGRNVTGTPTFRAQGDTPPNRFGIVNYGEIRFRARGVTDSGLKWMVYFEDVQDEADTRGFGVDEQSKHSTDETSVQFDGSWGRMILGGQDGPADRNYEGSANFVYTGAREHAIWTNIDSGLHNGRNKTNINDSSDATKIIYYTPRISGFQAGYSWAPEGGAKGSVHFTGEVGDDDNDGPFHEAAVSWRGKFGADTSAIVAANYTREEQEGGTTDAWRLSGTVTFGAISVGAGYVDNDDWGGVDTDAGGWDVGVAYNGGRWEASLTYLQNWTEDETADVEDEYDQVALSGVYNLGGGMSIAATLVSFDLDSEDDAELSTDGWAAYTKISFKF
jgi:hypothetical protein